MLFLMIATATARCFGTTTGLATPSFVITMCDPVVRSSTNPHASNTRTSERQWTGVIRGMRQARTATGRVIDCLESPPGSTCTVAGESCSTVNPRSFITASSVPRS